MPAHLLPPTCAWDILRDAGGMHPDRLAFVTAAGVPVTYRRLLSKCSVVASFLESRCGVRRGSRLAILMANSELVVVLHFAAARLGATVVNVNTSVTTRELASQLKMSNASTLVTSNNFEPIVSGNATAIHREPTAACQFPDELLQPLCIIWVAVDDMALPEITSRRTGVQNDSCAELWAGSINEFSFTFHGCWSPHQSAARTVEAPHTHHDISEDHHEATEWGMKDEIFQMYFTSGTTGLPKLIGLTHGAVCSHALATATEMRLHSQDVWLHG